MAGLRSFIGGDRGRAAWLVVLALLAKLMIPAGYMPVAIDGRMTITLCSGTGPEQLAMAHAMPGHGAHHDEHDGKAEMPCPFSGLAMAALGNVAVADVAALPALFALPMLRRATWAAPPGRVHRRRPARGPPALR